MFTTILFFSSFVYRLSPFSQKPLRITRASISSYFEDSFTDYIKNPTRVHSKALNRYPSFYIIQNGFTPYHTSLLCLTPRLSFMWQCFVYHFPFFSSIWSFSTFIISLCSRLYFHEAQSLATWSSRGHQ